PLTVTLRQEANGAVRVGNTRVLLELVIQPCHDGATPEAIVHEYYDTLKLGDVYAVIAYYLTHQEQVEEYLRQQEELAEKVQCKIEAADKVRVREEVQVRTEPGTDNAPGR